MTWTKACGSTLCEVIGELKHGGRGRVAGLVQGEPSRADGGKFWVAAGGVRLGGRRATNPGWGSPSVLTGCGESGWEVTGKQKKKLKPRSLGAKILKIWYCFLQISFGWWRGSVRQPAPDCCIAVKPDLGWDLSPAGFLFRWPAKPRFYSRLRVTNKSFTPRNNANKHLIKQLQHFKIQML